MDNVFDGRRRLAYDPSAGSLHSKDKHELQHETHAGRLLSRFHLFWLGHALLAAGERDPDWPCKQLKVPGALGGGPYGRGRPIETSEMPGKRAPVLLWNSWRACRTPHANGAGRKGHRDYLTGRRKRNRRKAKLPGRGSLRNSEHPAHGGDDGLERVSAKQEGIVETIREESGEDGRLMLAHSGSARDQETGPLKQQRGNVDLQDRRKTMSYACEALVEIGSAFSR